MTKGLRSRSSRESPEDREARVDRQEVARLVSSRMVERGISQKELEDLSRVSVATIRLIQYGDGTRIYSYAILSKISRALWPEKDEGYLHDVFHRVKGRDPFTPAEIEFIRQAIQPQPASESDLNELRARVARIEEHLGPDFLYGSGNVAAGFHRSESPHDDSAEQRSAAPDRPPAEDSSSH